MAKTRPKAVNTDSKVDMLMQRYMAAKSRKSESDQLRMDAGRYAWPNAREMYKGTETGGEGQEYTIDIFDSTAITESFKLAANIFSYLMPVGSKWFEFEASDYEENIDEVIKKWLSKATNITHSEIWRSNFMREMFAAIRSMVVFGTGVISVERNKQKELVYRAYHVGDICFEENSKGIVDTVFRRVVFTARQAIQEFGRENLPNKITDAADKASDANKKFKFIHCVFPNSDFQKKKITSLRFKSAYIYEDEKKIVKEEQFKSNPYFVMRFTVAPDELWGRGPVIELLPEIRMLNQMRLDFMEAAELANHPPMIAEDDGVIGQPSTGPRDIVYIRAGSQMPVPWNTGTNLPLTREVLADQQQIIKDGMFGPVFQTLEDVRNVSSATEAQIRKQDGMVIVSAVVGAVQKDALDPIITRSLLLIDKRKLPPAPRKFDFDIVYQGRLAMAMSALQADAIELHLAKWQPYAELGVYDNFKMNEGFQASAIANSVPAILLNEVTVVSEKQAAARQKQELAATAEAAETASKALKNVSGPIDETSLAAQG